MNFLEFILLTKVEPFTLYYLTWYRLDIPCRPLRGERLSLLDQHFTANLNKQAVLIWKYHETIVRVWTSTSTWRITDYLRRSIQASSPFFWKWYNAEYRYPHGEGGGWHFSFLDIWAALSHWLSIQTAGVSESQPIQWNWLQLKPALPTPPIYIPKRCNI